MLKEIATLVKAGMEIAKGVGKAIIGYKKKKIESDVMEELKERDDKKTEENLNDLLNN